MNMVLVTIDWKTAAEWAGECLDGLPQTERNINNLARREGWRNLGFEFSRKRKACGGGWEYNLSCLPESAQAEYRRRLDIVKIENNTEIQVKTMQKLT